MAIHKVLAADLHPGLEHRFQLNQKAIQSNIHKDIDELVHSTKKLPIKLERYPGISILTGRVKAILLTNDQEPKKPLRSA